MSAQPDPARDEPGTTPETIGAPSHYADAAEAPQWAQTTAKALACLPAALSMMSLALLALVGLALCLVIVAVLIL
ncbi:MAG: hypothetical protein AAGU78_11450 [Chloroflexota bacterium]|jgi:hypothetical protein|nr:hypothetical protein [Anaerolineae bacterium]